MSIQTAPVSLQEIRAAQERLAGVAIRTPVVRCGGASAGKEIWLKLENLQPIGSFKIRPIGNAVLAKPRDALAKGIYTASSGNSALAVAWMAKQLGIPAAAVVPNDAPAAKLARLMEWGARVERRSFEDWWRTMESQSLEGESGVYVDAVRNADALAGDGTVGLEILEQLPEIDAIFMPFGGGGLACGVACAIRALRPQVKIIACELESAQPLTVSRRAGAPTTTTAEPGFVSGVGFFSIIPEMWTLARDLIDDTLTVTVDEVAAAIRWLAEHNKVIAEGAGAIPVAAALAGRYDAQRVCAVVSGGNLGNEVLTTILAGASR